MTYYRMTEVRSAPNNCTVGLVNGKWCHLLRYPDGYYQTYDLPGSGAVWRPQVKTCSLYCVLVFLSASTINSPATPTVTRIPPVMAQNFCHGNIAAGRHNSSQNSTTSCRYSTTSPTTTSAVEAKSQNASESSDLSKALAAAWSADRSIDKFERKKRLCFILLLAVLLLRVTRDILLPGLNTVYKKIRYGTYKA